MDVEKIRKHLLKLAKANSAIGFGTWGGKKMKKQAKPKKVMKKKVMKKGGAKQANPWIAHVKAYAARNGVSYKDALSLARASYRG